MADLYQSAHSPHLLHRQRSRNCILVKDNVGKASPTCRSLPTEGHAYGIVETSIEGGAQEAFTWVSHVPSAPRRPGTDYQRLNKVAARQGVASLQQLAEFRKSHGDFPMRKQEHIVTPAVIPSDVIPGYAYGRPGRPSTPVAPVLSNRFGNDMEADIEERYRKYDVERAAMGGPLKFKRTKAAGSQRRQDVPQPVDPLDLWKMNKFKRVQPRCLPEGVGKSASLPSLQRTSNNGVLDEHSTQEMPIPGRHETNESETESEASLSPLHGSSADTEADAMSLADGDENAQTSIGDAETIDEDGENGGHRKETLVTLWFTCRHAVQEELQGATQALAYCVRSSFDDSTVRVNEVVIESSRQGLRLKRQRYVAWGQGALNGAASPDGKSSPSFSPVKLVLGVHFRSNQELARTARSVVDCICSKFRADLLQMRRMSPPFWKPSPVSPPPKRPRDGLGRPLPITVA